jgi:hypothetical protein
MLGLGKMSMGFVFAERWRKDGQKKNWIVFSSFRIGSHTFFDYE